MIRRLLLLIALTWVCQAHAAVSCDTVSSPGFSMNYVQGRTQSIQTYLEVTCTRTQTGDPLSIAFNVAVDDGQYAAGGSNRGREVVFFFFTDYVSYETYRNSSCTTRWAAAQNDRITGQVTWSSATDLGPRTVQVPWWGCVTQAQTGMLAGQYDDQLTLTLRTGNSQNVRDTSTAPVTIYAPSSCSITTPPGTVSFNYIAFGPAVQATTTFNVQCTRLMPYTMAIDPPTGTLLGLNYSLAVNTMSANGTGANQGYTITGTMAAGQAGACALGLCTDARQHSLVISY